MEKPIIYNGSLKELNSELKRLGSDERYQTIKAEEYLKESLGSLLNFRDSIRKHLKMQGIAGLVNAHFSGSIDGWIIDGTQLN